MAEPQQSISDIIINIVASLLFPEDNADSPTNPTQPTDPSAWEEMVITATAGVIQQSTAYHISEADTLVDHIQQIIDKIIGTHLFYFSATQDIHQGMFTAEKIWLQALTFLRENVRVEINTIQAQQDAVKARIDAELRILQAEQNDAQLHDKKFRLLQLKMRVRSDEPLIVKERRDFQLAESVFEEQEAEWVALKAAMHAQRAAAGNDDEARRLAQRMQKKEEFITRMRKRTKARKEQLRGREKRVNNRVEEMRTLQNDVALTEEKMAAVAVDTDVRSNNGMGIDQTDEVV